MAAAFGNVYPVSWFGDTGENKKSDAEKCKRSTEKSHLKESWLCSLSVN